MSKIKFVSDLVAVEAFVESEKKQSRGLDFSDALTSALLSTKAVHDSKTFKAGDLLFFRNDIRNNHMTKMKVTLDGKTFILLPESAVVAVQSQEL